MDLETKIQGAREISGRLLKAPAVISGIALFLLMCLVSYTVFRRYVMNNPVLGDAELVQIGMSLVVMMAMPYATFSGAHIRVDIFDRKIGAWGRYLGDVMARSLGAFFLFLLIQKTWDKALDAHEYGDVTNMIEIPVWIAYGAITVGMGGYALVLIAQLVVQFLSGVKDYE